MTYPSPDTHVGYCVLAGMDLGGELLFSKRLPTSEAARIGLVEVN